MILESATVLRTQGSFAWVSCRNQAGCQRCAEGRGCGGGILGRLLGDRLREIRVINEKLDLEPGDQVVIGLADSVLVKAALVMYLVPLLLMVFGAATFSLAWPAVADASALVGAAAGLLTGLWLARRYGNRSGRSPIFHPSVLERTGFACPRDIGQRSA
ncbi:MAG: SoxR reducing system RseC family protein [Gammaproteobacteria bacterium]